MPFIEAARAAGVGPLADPGAAPAAEPDRADRRVRDADDSAGDPAGVVPEFPGHRRGPADPDVGLAGGRRGGGDQHGGELLVDAAVSVPVPGHDAAGAELRGRRPAGCVRSRTEHARRKRE